MRFAVVIPFYQRDSGILSRALTSVFQQELPAGASLQVFIVDDSSPTPAAAEVELLPEVQRARVTLMRQPNGGPGAARNTGLDAVAEGGFDYVAFLDSDDFWAKDHLAEALALLERGYDFYFCDHLRTEDDITYFNRTERLRILRELRSEGVTVIDADLPILAFDRRILTSAYVETYLSQTSTIVVRQGFVQDLRFDTRLRNAGEDHMFWISLVMAGARTVVSWKCNVFCGQGVNIYFDAFDWTSTKVVDRIGYMLMFFQMVGRSFDLAPEDRATLGGMIRRYRRAYSYLFLRALLQRKKPSFALMWKLAAGDPALLPAMPWRFLSVLPNREAESKTW
ncbi:glycosyltransferase family 2 protein [Cereibacter changlensis JA139]|uniref:Glycosyltransferase family 2 protein n=2 Tax=Cereibacter changlensis TaxID=402884 RepID=A0A2T4JXP4_9RHOB|nr:glycosyltransferase family 2 protein [Cereibacter changlensis]PTE22688.1 glycosyltransferase family 2 protein [Cereibacter changlensis JA139]PZX58931.1 succinoglycan biosynthesis protein ExoW [Cereibacter changlensis]